MKLVSHYYLSRDDDHRVGARMLSPAEQWVLPVPVLPPLREPLFITGICMKAVISSSYSNHERYEWLRSFERGMC
jgi:hypothetical protein